MIHLLCDAGSAIAAALMRGRGSEGEDARGTNVTRFRKIPFFLYECALVSVFVSVFVKVSVFECIVMDYTCTNA